MKFDSDSDSVFGKLYESADGDNVRSDEAQSRMDLGLSALPGMIYSRSISTSLRLSDVDGGEAAGLPHALLFIETELECPLVSCNSN